MSFAILTNICINDTQRYAFYNWYLCESTSLTHLLDRHSRDNDIDEINVIQHSPYYSETQFIDFLSQKAGLCILELNIQNIFSTFDELESVVHRVNATNPIADICLNECWLNINDSPSGLNLQNCTVFYKPVTVA